ncbi:hypothetical protein Aau02nite_82350 [Amorphoplanes auranticolor]|uniref:Uncharacterized protein n=1 Tax=Actinoplanes auranticolor TaxID=47988 RepID=A0A919VXP8_9ACTN|nr:hypothetical protein Aau02nite_82350 [Actinoplanes auranticolor]
MGSPPGGSPIPDGPRASAQRGAAAADRAKLQAAVVRPGTLSGAAGPEPALTTATATATAEDVGPASNCLHPPRDLLGRPGRLLRRRRRDIPAKRRADLIATIGPPGSRRHHLNPARARKPWGRQLR